MPLEFLTEEELLERLTARPGNTVFLVGSGLTMPTGPGEPGVPSVDGFVAAIRRMYSDPAQLDRFEQALAADPSNPYPAAFRHLHRTRGPDDANEVVRRCVLQARISVPGAPPIELADVSEAACRRLEHDDPEGWHLSAGVKALGEILASRPASNRSIVLTSNFDPLVSVAIRRAGGTCYKFTLDADGRVDTVDGQGTLVVHIHGDWCHGDTLHTAVQLTRPRPGLAASLRRLLDTRPLVVIGYSGWDDVFTRALVDEVRGESSRLNIVWTFYESDEARLSSKHTRLLDALAPGLDRGRIVLSKGIDAHRFLPRLAEALGARSPVLREPPTSNAAADSLGLAGYLEHVREATRWVKLAGDHEPRELDRVFMELEISRTDLSRPSEPGDTDDASPSGGVPVDGHGLRELDDELVRRRHWPLDRRAEKQTIPSDALLDLARRVLIIGAAGTGKSTLLRRLVGLTAAARLRDDAARVPLWFSRVPSYRELDGDDLDDALAEQALRSVDLPDGPSDARMALAAAVRSGQCIVFIDGLDEASAEEQAQLAPLLGALEGHVVLASRPRLADAWNDVVQVTLHGIPAIAAERMLQTYFPGQPWVARLVEKLRGLADGRAWLEVPVLLGLAATLFRNQDSLPESILELYRRAVTHLLQSDRVTPSRRGDYFRPLLRTFARSLLMPEEEPLRVSFDIHELPIKYHVDLLRTGLFEGSTRLRFAHLSLGEFLAAEAAIDLAGARARLVEADAEKSTGLALEVLPMAHAIQAPASLDEALAEARGVDRFDHRLLRLLLRSLGYGGEGVVAFCRAKGAEVVKLLAERLEAPSGRFDNHERELMDAAEPALSMLRPFVPSAVAGAAFASLLRTRGEAAAEAHAATWLLGIAAPTYALARWSTTFLRQARAIVHEQPNIELIRSVTRGSEPYQIGIAIELLGSFPAHWPRIRPFLDHPNERVRRAAVGALLKDPDSDFELAERFTDDEPSIRTRMVKHFAVHPRRRDAFLPRLRAALTNDPSMRVRAAALTALAHEAWTLEWSRRALEETRTLPRTFTTDLVDLRSAALRALVEDEASQNTIRELLAGPKHFFVWNAELLLDLKRTAGWHEILMRRLAAEDVAPAEVQAMAGDPDAGPAILKLLEHADADVVASALKALNDIGPDTQRRILALLEHSKGKVRCAAIRRLGDVAEHRPRLRRFLAQDGDAECAAAILALGGDPESQDLIFENLHEGATDDIRRAAVTVLAQRPTGRAAVREYFARTKSKPRHEFKGPGRGRFMHGYIRAHIVQALAKRPQRPDLEVIRDAVLDPHPEVRAAAIPVALLDDVRRHKADLLGDQSYEVWTAAFRVLAADDDVQAQLTHMLREDYWTLRIAAFDALVDHAGARSQLRDLLASPQTPTAERVTLIQPLLRDPDARSLIRQCVRAPEREIYATALSLLRHDTELRRAVRDAARNVQWLRDLVPDSDVFIDVIVDDEASWPIFRGHIHTAVEEDDEFLLSVCIEALEHDESAYPSLRQFLDHESINVRRAALRTLRRDEASRGRLMGLLSSDQKELSEAAADALRDVREALPEYARLLGDPEKKIRRIALEVLRSTRDPAIQAQLLARVTAETDDELRHEALDAVAEDPNAVATLQQRLHIDSNSRVREAAARALGRRSASHMQPLTELPSVRRVLPLVRGEAVTGETMTRLSALLRRPAALELDSGSELADVVLGWLCLRLAWASEDGRMEHGRAFGEVAPTVERLAGAGQVTVIRVAMDVAELPREHLLRPTFNLAEAWTIAQHLRFADPPALVLACADVGLEHLSPPPLEPGGQWWGPTFFGFRLPAQ